MKHLIFCLFAIVFSSCADKEMRPISVTADKPSISQTAVATESGGSQFTFESQDKLLDKVSIRLLRKTVDKDKDSTAHFEIDFYLGGNVIGTVPVSINFGMEAGFWHLDENPMSYNDENVHDSHLFQLSNGFDACGYPAHHFLFFVTDGKVALVKRWISTSDADVYSQHTQFFPTFSNNRITAFKSREETSERVEDTVVQKFKNFFIDSTHYELANGRWQSSVIAPDVYRTTFTTE